MPAASMAETARVDGHRAAVTSPRAADESCRGGRSEGHLILVGIATGDGHGCDALLGHQTPYGKRTSRSRSIQSSSYPVTDADRAVIGAASLGGAETGDLPAHRARRWRPDAGAVVDSVCRRALVQEDQQVNRSDALHGRRVKVLRPALRADRLRAVMPASAVQAAIESNLALEQPTVEVFVDVVQGDTWITVSKSLSSKSDGVGISLLSGHQTRRAEEARVAGILRAHVNSGNPGCLFVDHPVHEVPGRRWQRRPSAITSQLNRSAVGGAPWSEVSLDDTACLDRRRS